jgi:ABC-2 type transport system ATP-binding protein
MTSTAPIIILESVSKSYGSLNAVDEVSFSVPKGSICGLIGHNGAGKTTLMKMLCGLVKPDSGSITLGGLDLSKHLREARSMIGYVPQKTSLYPEMSGYENLSFFGAIRGLSGKALEQSIDFCVQVTRLEEYLHSPASTYSGGLAKRLNLAIGLLGNPPILYLDEPTVGVDPHSREMILNALSSLRNEYATTILYTSHYLEEVEKICDRIVIIDHGHVVGDDTSAHLLRECKAMEIVFESPPFSAGEVPLSVEGMEGIVFTPLKISVSQEAIYTALPRLLEELSSRNARIERIRYGSGSLEQFIHTMNIHKRAEDV